MEVAVALEQTEVVDATILSQREKVKTDSEKTPTNGNLKLNTYITE